VAQNWKAIYYVSTAGHPQLLEEPRNLADTTMFKTTHETNHNNAIARHLSGKHTLSLKMHHTKVTRCANKDHCSVVAEPYTQD